MNRIFPKLFERGEIGRLELKNRIVKAPTVTCLAGGPDGVVTDRLIRYYAEVARGGTGLVIAEYSWIDKKASRSRPSHLSVADDDCIPGLSSLAQAIQDNGAKAALQIGHPGMHKALAIPPVKCPSQGVPPEDIDLIRLRGGVVPEELTFEEIQELVIAFGNAAGRVRTAGFDMVEIHGAHGYLITQFLSPRANKRTDQYGGSPENRMRFLLEIVSDARGKVGPEFPLGVRLSGTEYEPDGIMIEDTLEVVKALERVGVDFIHVSGGSRKQGAHLSCPMSVPVGHNVWAAEAVKKVVGIPVIASGSITTPDFAEDILESGQADFISLARPLFADPYWPQKAREGRPEDIVPCLRCNDGCQERSNWQNKAIMCTVNVALGKEDRLTLTPAHNPKKVAVVGGGPGGMEAARVCASRGHDVTLYEKRELGGALIEASVPEFKSDLRRLISYYVTQMEKLKIKVVREEATIDTIKGGNFDAVIVAVGGDPIKPEVPGINKPIVTTVLEVLGGKAQLGQRVYIVGGGIIGVEVGLFLAEQGKEVIFTTRQDELMAGVGSLDRTVYEQRLAKQKVTVYTGKRLDTVLDKGAVVVDKDGRRQDILTDSIVLAAGFVPRTTLREQLEKETSLEVYAVGDCVSPRKIFDAIHEGHSAAREI